MKIDDNGVIREMTAEEIAKYFSEINENESEVEEP